MLKSKITIHKLACIIAKYKVHQLTRLELNLENSNQNKIIEALKEERIELEKVQNQLKA